MSIRAHENATEDACKSATERCCQSRTVHITIKYMLPYVFHINITLSYHQDSGEPNYKSTWLY